MSSLPPLPKSKAKILTTWREDDNEFIFKKEDIIDVSFLIDDIRINKKPELKSRYERLFIYKELLKSDNYHLSNERQHINNARYKFDLIKRLNYDRPNLNDFILLSVLRNGPIGRVIKVIHKYTNKIYAMKIYPVNDKLIKKNQTALLLTNMHPCLMNVRWAFGTYSRIYHILDYKGEYTLFDKLVCKIYLYLYIYILNIRSQNRTCIHIQSDFYLFNLHRYTVFIY